MPGLIIASVLILAVSIAFLSRYPQFKERAAVDEPNILSGSEFLHEIYQANTVLYMEIQEATKRQELSGHDIYLTARSEAAKAADYESYYNFGSETPLTWAGEYMDELLEEWDNAFRAGLAKQVDYQITDGESGDRLANIGRDLKKLGTREAGEALTACYPYYIKLEFNDEGLLEHVWVRGEDADTMLGSVQRVMKSRYLERNLYERLSYSPYSDINWEDDIYYGQDGNIRKTKLEVLNTPKNCTICYALTEEQLEALKASSPLFLSARSIDNYANAGIQDFFRVLLLALGLAAVFLPLWKGYHLHEHGFPLHLEVVVLLLLWSYFVLGELAASVVMYTMTDEPYYSLSYMLRNMVPGISTGVMEGILLMGNLLFLTVAFGLWFTLVTQPCQIYVYGIRGYLKKRCLCYRILKSTRIYARRKRVRLKRELLQADLAQDRDSVLFRLIIANYLLLAFISLFWIFGIFLFGIYSALLYVFLKKYIHSVQEKYEQVLAAVESIAGGNLQTGFEEDWGMFNSCKNQLQEIQTGFSRAVEEEVKSQRMRTELITNVSHDLKTPLTAIITYISLLQEKDVTAKRQKEYLDVLERKALRLKILIEDLFELSKASSGSVTFHPERVDICHLMRQVYLEYEDRAKAAELVFRFQLPEQKVYLMLDGEKTYRIFDNLYANITKYAMPGTRVYVSAGIEDGEIQIELKNISGSELNVAPERLTERFVRGDSARSTEGSGLGLAIANTLVELQNGRMQIEIDGDLFKVTLSWKTEG